jgi:CO/xanthine dehydrogenase Mo-binding subunit
MRAIGRNASRREGPEKLCGLARYIDDVTRPGCLQGVTLRSTIPYGTIRSLTFDPAFPWDDFVIATARDIPGRNRVALIEDDQPLLADTRIMHAMEPIALVAHASRDRAYEALRHIQVEYERLDPVLTIEDALARTQLLRGDDNLFKDILIEKGDVARGLREADVIVEGEYHVPHQEHAYIENNGILAYAEPDGTIVVMGSLQCPFYVQKALKGVFGVGDDRVRVIQTATGGGFGGKEEYPNMIAGHAALLALKAGRPVKIIYDRHEDMLATTKRHPARVRHRTGVMRDGTIVAQDIDVVMDGGAYITLSPVVLSRGALHATGTYASPHARIHARAVATNTSPNGAFRGFGAPQTLFAAELHMEKIAATLGIDAVTLRLRNMVSKGSVLATGQTLRESIGAAAVMKTCLARSDYRRKTKEYARWNRRAAHPTWKGIGLALAHHGAGFTGRGEVMLASRAAVVLTRTGKLKALAASTEIGQGTTTMLAQVTADALGVPVEWVDVETPDTWKVPNSGPTVASRTAMVVGGLLQRAGIKLRERILNAAAGAGGAEGGGAAAIADAVVSGRRARAAVAPVGRAAVDAAGAGGFPATPAALARLAVRICGEAAELRIEEEYQAPPEIVWDDQTYRGDAYAVYSYAAAAIDLEVDKRTFEVTVRKVTTAQDIGKAINPLLVEGQIIGGTAQGLGYALLENVVYRDGMMANAQLTNYIIPTSLDMPPMDVVLVEEPYSRGPGGAKGIGELPMDVPGPAVAAAIFNATGLFIPHLPILPEHIAAAHADGGGSAGIARTAEAPRVVRRTQGRTPTRAVRTAVKAPVRGGRR